ncbi:MAG: hypothetical protein JXR83_01570 [Deltaproteobacteria bacterium]|nr:hypothetical protein [Deltaproteobacteria bacterium]
MLRGLKRELRPPRAADDEMTDEEQAQFIAPLLQQRIEAWIDEPIPLLKGKTMRQTCRTRAGRAKVVAMLKDQENALQGQPGGDRVDFARVYRELGLLDE